MGSLERIKDHIGHGVQEEREREAQVAEIQRLKEASAKMVDTWTNTFQGYQKQRLKDANRRAAEDEIRKVHLDNLEDEYRQDEKKKVLELAFKRLYEQTDRVKRLNAARGFAEALKEREQQQEVKKKVNAAFDQYDAEHLKCVMRDTDRHHDDVMEGLWKEKAIKAKNAENWNRQRRDAENRRREERDEEMREGFRIMDEAARYAEEERNEKMAQKKQKEEFKKNLDQEIETKQNVQKMFKVMDQEEETQAKIFADAKHKMKMQQLEKQRKDEELRQQMEAKIAKNLSDRDARIRMKEEANRKKAVLEIEAKQREEEELKVAKKAEELDAIARFYRNEMRAKEEQKLAERRQRFNERRGLLELEEELTQVEEGKKEKWETGEMEAQQFQLHQIAKKDVKKKAQQIEELNDYMRHMRGLDEEEELFQRYARMQIEDCEEKGLDTYTLRKAAKPGIECGRGPLFADRGKIRPKYYAAVTDPEDLGYVKKSGGFVDTKGRLGFTM